MAQTVEIMRILCKSKIFARIMQMKYSRNLCKLERNFCELHVVFDRHCARESTIIRHCCINVQMCQRYLK